MAGKVTRDHHSLRRNLKLNGKYVSNDGGDEGLSVSDAGAVSTSGALTVGGDLTVSGTTTTLNTQTVEVEDNILQLNTTQDSPDEATAATSGISVYRGNGVTQASLIFDEADDTWDLTNNIAVAGDIDLEGSIDVNGTANLDAVDIDGAVDMASTLAVAGDVTISSATSTKPHLTITNTNADANSSALSSHNIYLPELAPKYLTSYPVSFTPTVNVASNCTLPSISTASKFVVPSTSKSPAISILFVKSQVSSPSSNINDA